MNENIQKVSEAIAKGKRKLIQGIVQEALDAGCDPMEILNTGMIGAMDAIGERFKTGEVYVPEMLVAAKAMKLGVEVLKPHLASGDAASGGKVLICTVHGDLHDIGKNLVSMMIESAGFEVTDLGVDVPKEKIIKTLQDNPDTRVVALSALLTTTMPSLEETVAAIREENSVSHVKILIGGAPITADFGEAIGADAYASDAASAVTSVKELIA